MLVAPAHRHHSPLLAPTLDTPNAFALPAGETTVHLDRGYDSLITRAELARRGLTACISKRGIPAPIQATTRWVVERPKPGTTPSERLAWYPERRGVLIRFYLALANTIIIVRRLVREATYWRKPLVDVGSKLCYGADQ